MPCLSLWCRVPLRLRRGSWNGVIKMVRQVGGAVKFASRNSAKALDV